MAAIIPYHKLHRKDKKSKIKNGCTLTLKTGLSVTAGNTLYIYGQEGHTGELIANESKVSKCAGIGGADNEACGTIVINGGTIKAYGGSDAAGIRRVF